MFANGIGDYLLTLPAIRALSSLFVNQLEVACDEKLADLLLSNLPIRRIVDLETSDSLTGRRFNVRQLTESIGGCDLFISLNPWDSPAFTELLSQLRPIYSIGFSARFDLVLPLDRTVHSADLAFEIPRLFTPSLSIDGFADGPSLPPAAVRMARQFRHKLPKGTKLLSVHADTTLEKRWPANRWTALIDQFLELHPEFVVCLLGVQPLDQWAAKRVMACYGLPLTYSFALIKESQLFAGIDSSLLHAADLFRVASLGLFGLTHPREWGVRFARHQHLHANGSMEEITVKEALSALSALAE